MRLLPLLLALLAVPASAQTTVQVYRFLLPFEGDTAKVVHRPNGELVVGLGHRLAPDMVGTFTHAQEQALFLADYHAAMRAVHLFAPDFDELPMDARLVITSLYWTCGTTGLLRFHRLREAVEHRMWEMAAYELADSRRAHQIQPSRRAREYDMLAALK